LEVEVVRQEGGSPRLLIVDGDAAFRRELRGECEQFGYQVIEAETSADGLREFEELSPSLVRLETVLPDGSGLDVCRNIRRSDPKVPILMVSARGEEIDVVVGLEIGADDYVIKPVRMRELLARITAHLRKARLETTESSAGRLEFKDLVIDINERRISKEGSEVDPQPRLGLRVPDRDQAHRRTHPEPAPQDRDELVAALLHPGRARHRLPLHQRSNLATPAAPAVAENPVCGVG